MHYTLLPSGLLLSSMRRSEKKASRVMRKKTATLATDASASLTSETKPIVASVLAEQSRNGQPVSEEAIRLRAYRKWRTAGKHIGDGVNFWVEAKRELSKVK
jgi:hypothetical protein